MLYKNNTVQTSFALSMFRVCIILSTVAFVSNLILTFHSRWSVHRIALMQYESLALSEICSNPQLRMRSEEVNNCSLADRMTGGSSLPPVMLALLETLQRLALCAGELESTGAVYNRCDAIVESLANASAKIIMVGVFLLVSIVWMARQYCAIQHMRCTRLPLDSVDYPNTGGLPSWLQESD